MNPIPESPETIEAQLDWLTSGKRQFVLLPPGTALPSLHRWWGQMALPEGLLVWDERFRTRLQVLSDIEGTEGGVGALLGYGIAAKPAQASDVVTVRSPEGVEKQAVATDRANLRSVLAAAHGVADPGDTVQRENGAKVVADRLRCLDGRELKVRPYRGESDSLALAAAARADHHAPLNPTHVIEHDGEIVGYFGVNSLPLYRLWFHSEKLHAGASTRLLFMIENHFRMAGVAIVATVINEASPFYPAAGRGGYLECLGDRLFLKQLL